MAHRILSKKSAALALAAPVLGAVTWAVIADETDKSQETVDNRAVEVLQQLSKHLAGLDAYSATIVQSMQMEGPLGSDQTEQKFQMAVAEPNRFAVRAADVENGDAMISDGDKFFINVPMYGAYVETEAPKDLTAVLKQVQEATIMIGEFPAGLVAPMLVPGGPGGELGTLRSASYRGTDELDGAPVHRLSLVLVPELTETATKRLRDEMGDKARMVFFVDAWIGAEDEPWLHKMHFDLAKMLREMMPDMFELMPEMADMKYEMTMTFTDWRTGGDVREERFAFEAPDSAEKHESLDELVAAILAPAAPPSELLGQPAPEFEIQLLDGATVTSAQHKGSDIVILDFWATWCGPCIQAMPDLMAVAEAYKDRNVVFYAVNVQEKPETVESFIEQRNWDLKVPMDRDGSLGRKFKVGGIPQTVVIDKDGTVQAVHVGFSPGMKSQLERELDTLLRGEKLVAAGTDQESE